MKWAPSKDIVDTAVGAGSFTTLVSAVKAADLVDTMKGAGPFTVNEVIHVIDTVVLPK